MPWSGWLQLAVLGAAILVCARVLGAYIARVFGGEPLREDRVFAPVERAIYRVTGVTPESEQRWTGYARSVLAFSAVSVLGLYLLQRLQGALFLNPTDVTGVPPALAFNTAVSFVTNTNWQNYGGESTMSHLTQMSGLAVQNFVSAAVGIAVAIALVRGITRRRSETIGNFWADLTRAVTRILLPLSIVLALVLVARGAIQSLDGFTEARTLEGATQSIPGGPFASQEAIKELGTNGGGTLNANSAHPLSNPTPFTNLLEIFALLLIPFSLAYAYGRLVRDTRQGWAVFAAMAILWAGSAVLAGHFESEGNPRVEAMGAAGSNMEGKEARFGSPVSGIFAASTTGTSTGAVEQRARQLHAARRRDPARQHDARRGLAGRRRRRALRDPRVRDPRGVRRGPDGRPDTGVPRQADRRARDEARDALHPRRARRRARLLRRSRSCSTRSTRSRSSTRARTASRRSSTRTPRRANNNGSAFGGLTGNTDWFNTTLGLAMLAGRFVLIVLVLALAGALARKQPVPASAGTFPTGTPTFTGLLVAVILVVVGLTYLPMLALGPILEHLQL